VLLDAEFYVQSKNIFIGSASLNLLLFALFFCFSQAQKQYTAHLQMSTHLVVS